MTGDGCAIRLYACFPAIPSLLEQFWQGLGRSVQRTKSGVSSVPSPGAIERLQHQPLYHNPPSADYACERMKIHLIFFPFTFFHPCRVQAQEKRADREK